MPQRKPEPSATVTEVSRQAGTGSTPHPEHAGPLLPAPAGSATALQSTAVDAAPPQRAKPFPAAGLPAVPGYEILGELGRGGMGVVYKARQLSLNRLVALKMIRDGVLATPAQRQRFRQEAEAVASLNHPNIVHIYDIGELGDRPYLCLEFIDGCTLKELLRRQALPARQAAELLDTLARAMQHVHEQKLVHRDLKPANILLANRGPKSAAGPACPTLAEATPKISDFGLAKQLDADGSLTPSGNPIGTASYMPPEQARGEKRIGPPADVYALGAILYELLTGQPPFDGDSWVDIVQKVINQKPKPLRQLHGQLSPDLERICLKCLEKDPQYRYQTGAALAADVRAFLDGKPIDARTSTENLANRLDVIVSPLKPKLKPPAELPWVERAGYQIVAPLADASRMPAYQARHVASDQLVALRLLGQKPSKPKDAVVWEQRLQDMRQEGRILARLNHPSIPRFVAQGEHEGYHYLAIEYAEGKALHRAKADRPFTPTAAARLLRTLVEALHAAHGQGIAHGDLRPNNVLLAEDGKVWLTNFGVLRDARPDVSASQMLDQMRFLAPEQIVAETNDSTPATNIYTLGMFFYELLAGRSPFERTASWMAGIERLLHQLPTPPSHFEPAVPPELDAICLKCLQKLPAERFSAAALTLELARFLAGEHPLPT